MKKMIFFVLLLTPCFSWTQSYRAVQNERAVKTAIQQKHQKTKSITAHFTETTHSKMLANPQITKGSLLFEKESKIRWENSTNKQLVLLNGNTVNIYENNRLINNATSQRTAKQLQKMMLNLLSGDFLNEKNFTIQYQESETHYCLSLLPTSSRTNKHVTEILLIFDKKTLLLNEMTIKNGETQKIEYAFYDIHDNNPIDPQKFTQP